MSKFISNKYRCVKLIQIPIVYTDLTDYRSNPNTSVFVHSFFIYHSALYNDASEDILYGEASSIWMKGLAMSGSVSRQVLMETSCDSTVTLLLYFQVRYLLSMVQY